VSLITMSKDDYQQLLQNFILYPNPLSGSEVNIVFHSSTVFNALIQVMDMRGVVCINEKVQINIGENQMILDASSIKDGLYFVTINMDGAQRKLKLLVQR
jgi:Secretion system C-terminal sorting domain